MQLSKVRLALCALHLVQPRVPDGASETLCRDRTHGHEPLSPDTLVRFREGSQCEARDVLVRACLLWREVADTSCRWQNVQTEVRTCGPRGNSVPRGTSPFAPTQSACGIQQCNTRVSAPSGCSGGSEAEMVSIDGLEQMRSLSHAAAAGMCHAYSA